MTTRPSARNRTESRPSPSASVAISSPVAPSRRRTPPSRVTNSPTPGVGDDASPGRHGIERPRDRERQGPRLAVLGKVHDADLGGCSRVRRFRRRHEPRPGLTLGEEPQGRRAPAGPDRRRGYAPARGQLEERRARLVDHEDGRRRGGKREGCPPRRGRARLQHDLGDVRRVRGEIEEAERRATPVAIEVGLRDEAAVRREEHAGRRGSGPVGGRDVRRTERSGVDQEPVRVPPAVAPGALDVDPASRRDRASPRARSRRPGPPTGPTPSTPRQ